MRARLIAGLMAVFFSAATTQWTWQEPCVSEPYAYAWQDERRAIAVTTMEVDKSVVYVADVQLRSVDDFHTARPEKGTGRLSDMVKDTDAVLAVNADNYRSHSYGVIIRDGECIRQNKSTRHLLAVRRDGSLEVVTDRKTVRAAELARRLTAQGVRRPLNSAPCWWRTGKRWISPRPSG